MTKSWEEWDIGRERLRVSKASETASETARKTLYRDEMVRLTVALDSNVFVDNHDFDMAVALLLLGDDGVSLVFSNVEKVMKMLLSLGGKGSVHLVGDHFIGSTLVGEKFALT